MTDLVAEAIALCEKEIESWQRTVTFLVSSKEKHAESNLNSWLTHKAEFGEHKDHSDTCGVRMINGVKSEGCRFAETKAKRLLGVSE